MTPEEVKTPTDALSYLREIALRAITDTGSSDDTWEDVGPRFMSATMKVAIMAAFYAEKFQSLRNE